MNSVTTKISALSSFFGREFEIHRWEYLTFTIVVFACFLFALLSEITRLNDVVSYLSGGDFDLAKEIRSAPLEHFAPSTIAYGTALLYFLISGFRILCGTTEWAVDWFKEHLLTPLTNFYSTLCRAMLGGLLGIAILSLLFDFSSFLWVFFIFSFIYPGVIMLMVQSMGKLVEPIEELKIDHGLLGTRLVGLLMMLLALISGGIVYLLDKVGHWLL